GYVALVKKPALVEQSQSNNLTNTQTTTPPPANVSQLTKEQVLNGYNECGQQFKTGHLEVFNSYEEYNNWLSGQKVAKKQGCAFIMNLKGEVFIEDLDNNGTLEAVTLAESCTYKGDCYPSWSAGKLRLDNVSLIVFKNLSGAATVVDEHDLCSNANGECNMSINSTDGNSIVVDFGGAHLLPPARTIFKFINGKLGEQ
ncbi:MAG: hypothetical protein HY451_01780, partial [Parcubacteria group bacterium]|nr:hypothetical protein [Parcubacteria group bacterium]